MRSPRPALLADVLELAGVGIEALDLCELVFFEDCSLFLKSVHWRTRGTIIQSPDDRQHHAAPRDREQRRKDNVLTELDQEPAARRQRRSWSAHPCPPAPHAPHAPRAPCSFQLAPPNIARSIERPSARPPLLHLNRAPPCSPSPPVSCARASRPGRTSTSTSRPSRTRRRVALLQRICAKPASSTARTR